MIRHTSQDLSILLKKIFGTARQMISPQEDGNTDYNQTNVNLGKLIFNKGGAGFQDLKNSVAIHLKPNKLL